MSTSTAYQVTGLTCEHCVRAVREEVGQLAGVDSVDVALVPGGTSTVTVTHESAAPADDAVAAALAEAGDYRLAGSPA